MDNYMSKYKISSYSEEFYNLKKINKFGLDITLVLLYILKLVL